MQVNLQDADHTPCRRETRVSRLSQAEIDRIMIEFLHFRDRDRPDPSADPTRVISTEEYRDLVIRCARNRVEQGYYDQPEVWDQAVERLLGDVLAAEEESA